MYKHARNIALMPEDKFNRHKDRLGCRYVSETVQLYGRKVRGINNTLENFLFFNWWFWNRPHNLYVEVLSSAA